MKLYGWTGFVPRRYLPEGSRTTQTSMWVVMPSDKAWRERFGYGLADFKNYVHAHGKVTEESEHPNAGARLAIANPGTVFMQDTWHNARAENVWIEQHGQPW